MNRGGGKYINAVDEQQHKEKHQEHHGCEDDDCYIPKEHAAWEQELLAEFRRSKGGGRRAKGGGKGLLDPTDDRRGPKEVYYFISVYVLPFHFL